MKKVDGGKFKEKFITVLIWQEEKEERKENWREKINVGSIIILSF